MPVNPTSSQSEASRRNGSLSRGPATSAGLARSSANSLKSGVCSKQLVLPGESLEDFKALLESFIQEYKPSSPTEDVLVEELAVAKWRIDRAREAQNRTLGFLDLSLALDDEKLARKLNNLHRYESQYRRQFDSALKQLQAIRAAAEKSQQQAAAATQREQRSRQQFAKTMHARHAAPVTSTVQNEPEPLEAQAAAA